MPNVTPKPGVPVAMKVVIFGAPLVGLLIGAMHFVQKGQIDACNKGEAKVCETLLKNRAEVDPDLITNEEYKPQFVQKRDELAAKQQAKEDLKAAQKQAREELETKLAVQSALMSSCEASLKSSLKDPGSLQIHNRYPGSLQIEYSATNSFGGRIRSLLDCKTGKSR